jgi:hypothetical protein
MRGGTPANPLFVADVTGGAGGGGPMKWVGGALALAGAAAAGAAIGAGIYLGTTEPIMQSGIPGVDDSGTFVRRTSGGLSPDVRQENASARTAASLQRLSDHADALTGTLDDLRKGTHAYLDELIKSKGGAFQRAGEAGGTKTMDANAGKLVQLFTTSTNPSLKSMQDNLRIMQAEAKRHPTDKVLGGYIKDLQNLVSAGLASIAAAIVSLGGYAGPGIKYPLLSPGKIPPKTGTSAKASGGKDDLVSIHIATPVSAVAVTKASAVVNRSSGTRTLGGNIALVAGGIL